MHIGTFAELILERQGIALQMSREHTPQAAAWASAALRRSWRERSAAAQAFALAALAACMASIWRSSGRVASGIAVASSSCRDSAAWLRRVMSASSRFSASSLPLAIQPISSAVRISVSNKVRQYCPCYFLGALHFCCASPLASSNLSNIYGEGRPSFAVNAFFGAQTRSQPGAGDK